MRPLLLSQHPLRLPYSLGVLDEGKGKLELRDGETLTIHEVRDLHHLQEVLQAFPYDRVVLLPPYGIRMLPYLSRLDQESVDIRSVSMLLPTREGFVGVHPLWRAFVSMVSMKNRVVGVVGSGHTGRSAVYAARRAGARKVRLITRRAPIDTQKLFDVFSLTFHPIRPLQEFLASVDVLFWCSVAEPPPDVPAMIPDTAMVVDVRLPVSSTPWPGVVIRGEEVLAHHLEASREYPVDV